MEPLSLVFVLICLTAPWGCEEYLARRERANHYYTTPLKNRPLTKSTAHR